MATVIAVDDLVEDIRTNLNLPTFVSGSGFVSQEAVYRMVQQSAFRLSGVLHETFGDTDFFAQASATCGTSGITSLPADLFKLLGVSWNRDSDTIIQLETAHKRDLSWTIPIAWTVQLPRYVMARNVLQFYPPPTDTGMSLTIQYTTAIFPSLTPGSSNTFDGQAGWADWIVLDVCAKIRRKEQKDPSDFIAQREEVEAGIRAQAGNRDAFRIYEIKDETHHRWDYWRPWRLLP